MFGFKKSSSVSSNLNYDVISIASERDLQLMEPFDEMKKEQYFLLKGFHCQKDENRLESRKRVEEMVQAEWDKSINVKGFVEKVAYSDFGLPKEDQQLSLLRLSSEIPCVFGKPKKEFQNGSVLVTISEPVKSYSCCGVPLYQLEAIPDNVSLINMCQEDTGVTLGIDAASNFWLFGMWFQVAVTKRSIKYAYENVCTQNTVKDKNPNNQMSVHLENLLNNVRIISNSSHKGKEVTLENYPSQWFDAGLFCVTFLSYQMKGINDYLELHLLKDMDIHKVQLVVSSPSRNACQKYHKDFTSHYEDMRKEYSTVPLPSSYPRNYRDMLKDMIQAKYHTYLTVTMNKGRTVDFVLAKQHLSEVENFIKTYLECNAPKKPSNIDDLVRMAKPLGPVTWPWTEGVEDATSSTRHTFRKSDENDKVYIGMLAKPEPHVEYLKEMRKPDLDIICMDHEAQLKFEKLQILVEVDDRSKLVNCLLRLEDLYNRLSIQTKEIPSQCIPEDQRGLLIKPVNSTLRSVTGTSSAMSFIAETMQDVSVSEESALLENISLNPAGSACKEYMNTDERLDCEKKTSTSSRKGMKRERQLLNSPMQISQEEDRTYLMLNTGTGGYSYIKTADTQAYQHLDSKSYVEVGRGDITKLEVDAIVNAANNQLKHVGGVAHAIVVAGGESIQTESTSIVQKRQLQTGDVCITGAGRLPCKMVIHAVAPAYQKYQNKQECLTVLERAFRSCFEQASKNGVKSMAIPPLGAGQYAIPAEDVAEAACVTLQEFLNKNPGTSLRLVRFVDIGDNVLAICRGKLDIMVQNNYFSKM